MKAKSFPDSQKLTNPTKYNLQPGEHLNIISVASIRVDMRSDKSPTKLSMIVDRILILPLTLREQKTITDIIKMKTVLFFIAAVICGSMAMPAFTAEIGERRVDSDISYTVKSDPYAVERCKLDVSYPADTCGCPVVVWYHGGGLTSGQKELPDSLCREKDVVVVGINYRQLPNVTVDVCLDDCAEALAWVFNNIDKYGGDKSKIFVSGHSAGGYITAMLGFDKSWLRRYEVDADSVAALIPFSGQAISHYSYRSMNGIPNLQPTIDEFAPLYHVRADAPPVVLITGDREMELFGRYEENAYMWRMLKLVGHKDVTLYEIGGHDHGGMVAPAFPILIGKMRKVLADKDN